ncbi:MAG: methyl-accepting chemotaxis protein [Myxococcaceae bacterium]
MGRPGFKLYLLILFSLLGAVPVFGLSHWDAWRWDGFQETHAQERGLQAARAYAREVTQQLEGYAAKVETLARQVEARGSEDPAALRSLVQAQAQAMPGFVQVGIANLEGIAMAAQPTGPFPLPTSFLKELGRIQTTLFTEPTFNKDGVDSAGVVAPILDAQSELRGFAYGVFDLRAVQRTLRRELGFEASAYLFDSKGQLLAPVSMTGPARSSLARLELFKTASGNGSLRTVADASGEPLRAAVVTLNRRKLGWTVAVAWAPGSLVHESLVSKRAGILAALIALLAAVVVAVPLSSWITRPISQTALAVAAAGKGDLSRRLPAPSRWTPREAHSILTNFRTMLDQLRALLTSVRNAKDEMTPSLDSLRQMLSAQTTLMEQQALQLAEISMSAREVQEMSALSTERAGEVLIRASNANELRVAGEKSVEQSLHGLQEIRDQTNAIIATIVALLERTLEVGQIAESVKDIADQSNVVALSAAIQAMRAGEFGRGFELVAEQMRSLSNSSIESTVRIREILDNAEKAIRATATTTEGSSRKIQHGIEQIQDSGNRLRELSIIVDENSVGTRIIAGAVKQQYVGIQEIAQALGGLDQAMGETAMVFEHAHRMADGLRAASDRISGCVDAFRLE